MCLQCPLEVGNADLSGIWWRLYAQRKNLSQNLRSKYESCFCLRPVVSLLHETDIDHFNLITYSMEQSSSYEANRFATTQKNSPHFMEPEGSLPHS
jgi:hypothetical protein